MLLSSSKCGVFYLYGFFIYSNKLFYSLLSDGGKGLNKSNEEFYNSIYYLLMVCKKLTFNSVLKVMYLYFSIIGVICLSRSLQIF